MGKPSSTPRSQALSLDKCRGCGAVGLVEIGEVPMCAGCLPDAFAIHLAKETIKRAAERIK